MENEIILTEIIGEYEELIKEVQRLKIVVATLAAEKDDLELNICRRLRAEYDEKIGNLELQITQYNLEIERLKYVIEKLQASVNRNEKSSRKEAEEQADEKLKEYYEDLEKQAKQAKEDQEFAQRRAEKDKENAENAGYEGNNHGEEEEIDWDKIFENINDFAKAFEEFMKAVNGFFGGDDGTSESGANESGSEGDSRDRGDSAKKNVNPAKELKSLYRKIVKALHPDNKKNRSQKDDELLMEAKVAFEEGNIERLRQIAEMIEDEDLEKRFKDKPEDIEELKQLKRKLKMQMMVLKRDIHQIKNSFPYKEKEFLADDEAVAARQDELKRIIESCKNTITALNDRIDLLQKQMNG